MPVSRITFAIGDLVSEIRALRDRDSAAPITLVLNEPDYSLVVGEIENHYGQKLPPDETWGWVAVKFAGVLIVRGRVTGESDGAIS